MKKLLLLSALIISLQSCQKNTYDLNLQVLKACELFQEVKKEKGFKIDKKEYFKNYTGMKSINPKTRQAFTINNEDLDLLYEDIEELIIGANLYNISNGQISDERRGSFKLTKSERDKFYTLLLETCNDFQELETRIAKELEILGLEYRTRRNDNDYPPSLITIKKNYYEKRFATLDGYIDDLKWIDKQLEEWSNLIKFVGQTPNKKPKPKAKTKVSNSDYQMNCQEIGRQRIELNNNLFVYNIIQTSRNRIIYSVRNLNTNRDETRVLKFDKNCNVVSIE